MKKLTPILIIGLIIVVLGCAIIALLIWSRPLGPALTLATQAPPIQPTATTRAIQAQPTATPRSVEQIEGACGGSGVATLLLLGESSPEDIPHRGADAIRLMKVDFDQETVAVLAIPPDLWVQTPALKKLGISETTLTVLYWEVKQATQGSEKHKMVEATQAFAQTLADNWGYSPDHYLTVSQPRFAETVDTLGGIEISLPETLDATPEGHGVFPAGKQRLDGQRVVDFVRVLAPASGGGSGEWARFARQNQALRAILAAVLARENWPKIPDLARQFSNVVATDLSVRQMSDLICMVQKAGNTAAYAEIPPEVITMDSAGRQIADVEEVKKLLELVKGK